MAPPTPSSNAASVGLVALAATLWGGWGLVLRPAHLPPQAAVAVVFATLLIATPWCLRRGLLADRGALWALVLLGLADTGNAALYFAAIDRGPLAIAVLSHYLAPVLVALAAPYISKQPLSRRTLVATPVSLLGLLLLVGGLAGPAPLVTAALGGGSAFFYAVILFAAKRASRAFRPLEITTLHAWVSLAALLLLFGKSAVPSVAAALPVALGALVCGLGASWLFYRGLERIEPPVAAVLAYLEPVSAAALGWMAFGETLGAAQLMGGAAIVLAGVYVACERRKNGARLASE